MIEKGFKYVIHETLEGGRCITMAKGHPHSVLNECEKSFWKYFPAYGFGVNLNEYQVW